MSRVGRDLEAHALTSVTKFNDKRHEMTKSKRVGLTSFGPPYDVHQYEIRP